MSGYASNEYIKSKKWISQKIQEGFDWESVKHFCVTPDKEYETFEYLQEEEAIIPQNMDFEEWPVFVAEVQKGYSLIGDMYGISAGGNSKLLPVPTDLGSPWVRYKNYLLGKLDGKQRISDAAVTEIERNSHWILNHLLRDTRTSGPKKGLVMGSVQSGKTANMIGLATMAAHYDWNFIIILSGTIDNLRKQTRDRFRDDLIASGGAFWHILDKTSNPDYMKDIESEDTYMTDGLTLNMYQEGMPSSGWMHRYITVCLKNSTRLRNLIKWLHSNPARAARLRVLVIDDEADQASVNTRKMDPDETDEELLERTAVNQLIIDLVNGRDENGAPTKSPFQAMNYISFTATPYANVLNESGELSLYPKDFICSLPESKEYFGAKVIFGSAEDDRYPGLDIIRDVPTSELSELKTLHDGAAFTPPVEFKKSVCWFLCAAAILRLRGHKKPISMLIHTTAKQNGHFNEYETLKSWLERERTTGSIMSLCETVYADERGRLTVEGLRDAYPDYGAIDSVNGEFPEFDVLKPEIELLLGGIENILLDENKELTYRENALHLCVDNCSANRIAEEGVQMRIVYPSSKQLSAMKKAPVFIVMGGSTLARGLTIEGLTCTYFGRDTNQADTLMQMARWFGYRKGYELLQRIWMPAAVQRKFALLEKIDEKLKREFEDFMVKGKSPAQFGPRITTSATIARFLLTAKNKAQNAVECDLDFSGDSYETTKFENGEDLEKNIEITEQFLAKLGDGAPSECNDSAYIWRNIDFGVLEADFFAKYKIFDCSSLSKDIPLFLTWMKQMNQEGRYVKWNVAIVGDKRAEAKWVLGSASVGKIERSRKTKPAFIDIGSLRSGPDALCDICPSQLTAEQRALYQSTVQTKKNIISARGGMGAEDTPLLLLYRIDKERGKDTKAGTKTKLNSTADIIGFSIIIAGEPSGKTHAKSVTVRLSE